MKWKFISAFEAGIISMLFITTIMAVGLPDGCIATGLDGRYLCWRDNPTETTSTFDLTHWKLQIPGPQDISPIGDYSSKYFYRTADTLVFWVDSSETGTTPNSEYVRSELRELIDPADDNINWSLQSGTHKLTAKLQVTQTTADQVTVAQVHGITTGGSSKPPLLRVALMNGDLYAWVKTNSSGSNTDKILLVSGIGDSQFDVDILIKNKLLTVSINGSQKLSRNVSFWKYNNYFKAGNYPQATSGVSEVRFYKLEVTHI